MKYRTLSRAEIAGLAQIDRTETIDSIHYYRDGELTLEPEHWDVPEWSPDEKQRRIVGLQAIYDEGAIFFGAFDGETLVGMSVLGHTPVQTGAQRLNLEGLWVSHAYRNRGVGKTLFGLAAEAARERGARSMYVSATPSRNTIRFYRSLGCQLADPVDPRLFEKEPEDIHLELQLR